MRQTGVHLDKFILIGHLARKFGLVGILIREARGRPALEKNGSGERFSVTAVTNTGTCGLSIHFQYPILGGLLEPLPAVPPIFFHCENSHKCGFAAPTMKFPPVGR